ncbi:MAG: hypothetical protein WB783_15150 [Arenicellales bacterium]
MVAWISGSLAGITAILYSLGFVATKAADQILGVGFDFASRDPVFYVARGGSLVIRTALFAVWPALSVIALLAILRWGSHRISPRVPRLGDRWVRIANVAAAPAVALVMSVVTFAALRVYVLPTLKFGGLVFTTPPKGACAHREDLLPALMAQDHAVLDKSFMLYALCAGLVLGIGIAARSTFVLNRPTPWLVLSGVAVFLILVGVPIAYGTLAVPVTAPNVRVDPPLAAATGRLRLLSRTDKGATIWLEDSRQVLWLSAGKIDSLIIGPSRPVATLSCPSDDAPRSRG